MRPARGLVLVRPIEAAETYAGGTIVVPENARQRLTIHQCECVVVGDHERCDDPDDCDRPHLNGEFHNCPVVSGDWLLVRPRSYLAVDAEHTHWLIRQRDVLAIFRGEEVGCVSAQTP